MSEQISVKELQKKVDEWHELRKEKDELELQVSQINEKLEPLSRDLIKIMESLELKNFQGTKGKVQMVKINYVNSPKGEAEKQAFFDHLKEEGLFDTMATVHHKTINSYFSEKLEKAIENGEELNIPGLEIQQRIEIRKGK